MGDRLKLGGWRHLSGRFFEVARARPPSPREQSEIAALLRPEEVDLFWEQPAADLRHGLEAAREVLRRAPGRRDLARMALLHDVGKAEAALGAAGRAVASLLGVAGLPAPGRLGSYLRHEELGAARLAGAGAEAPVVEFARSHHGERPASIPPADWELLQAADLKARSGPSHPIR